MSHAEPLGSAHYRRPYCLTLKREKGGWGKTRRPASCAVADTPASTGSPACVLGSSFWSRSWLKSGFSEATAEGLGLLSRASCLQTQASPFVTHVKATQSWVMVTAWLKRPRLYPRSPSADLCRSLVPFWFHPLFNRFSDIAALYLQILL